jgi:hypothetical protein
MHHTITFRHQRGLVTAEVRTSPPLAEQVKSAVERQDEDPASVVARFELLPHSARRLMERLGEEIEAAESEGLS